MLSTRTVCLLAMAVFALQPVGLGAWLALIPHVKAALGLTKGELAIALLGMPLALIPSMTLASRVVARFGPRHTLAVGLPLQAGTFLLPLLAWSQATLFLALAGVGLVMSFMQVSLNVYAGRLEKARAVTVMSRCHGFWALGLMAGSLCMALWGEGAAALGLGLAGGISALAGSVLALRLPHLGQAAGTAPPPPRRLRQVPPRIGLIAVFTFAVAMSEGAMADWAAVYLAERLGAALSQAGIAVTLYSGALAAGRFLGDAAKLRFGAVRLARGTVLCAIAGLLCLTLPLPLGAAYVGFVLIGLGLAVGFPLGISAAAALDNTYESQNIALTSMLAVTGFLVGPPMIGGLAQLFDLRVGLAALIPFLATAAVLAGDLDPPPTQKTRPPSGTGL